MSRRLLGAVLAGGRSSRFGTDKAEALWQGKPLVQHALDALRPLVDDVVLCGRAYGGALAIPDRPEAGMGPLAGLNAALHHAAAQGFAAVLCVGCDTPLLPAALLERLSMSPGPCYVAGLPVIGYWPAALASQLDVFLSEDRKHAVRAWAASVAADAVDWPPLPNINEPGDIGALPKAPR